MDTQQPLQLHLFGSFSASIKNQTLTFRTDKIRALFVYLLLENGRFHRRELLAPLLWPDLPEASARKNLRNSLFRLRNTIDAKIPGLSTRLFTVSKSTIQVNIQELDGNIQCDVHTFQNYLKSIKTHKHDSLNNCAICLEQMVKAAVLYQNDFLIGFSIADAAAYEQWLLIKREALHHQAIKLFDSLIDIYQNQRKCELVQQYARRLLKIEPWREQTHRHLMLALVSTGQSNSALMQYETCKHILAMEFDIEPSAETQALFERIQKQGKKAVQKPKENNLPIMLTPYFRKGTMQNQLASLIADQRHRLVTIVGEGGVGKTRLALETGSLIIAKQETLFPDGVWMVSLADIPAQEHDLLELVALTTAKTLNFQLDGENSPTDQLLQALKPLQMLLIMDNFEHILAAADIVYEWLIHAPYLTILSTSREPLNFQAETIFPLTGLPLPSTNAFSEQANWQELPECVALQLFQDRASRQKNDFKLTSQNVTQIIDICHLVGGNPLGIELAASMIGQQDITAIPQAIRQSLDTLATSMRDVPLRHRSMKGLFMSSWALLLPEEQRILAHLSLFQGDFTAPTAHAVAGANAATLERFRWKSLLQLTEDGRFTMHDLMRRFGLEQLEKMAEQTNGQKNFSCYFLNWLQEKEPILYGQTPTNAVRQILREWSNIEQAWQWAVAGKDADSLLNCLPGLLRFYRIAGLQHSVRHLFTSALAQFELAASDDALIGILIIRLLIEQANDLLKQGESKQAHASANQSMKLAKKHKDFTGVAQGYLLLGQVLQAQGNPENALQQYKHALEYANRVKNQRIVIRCLSHLNYFLTGTNAYCRQALRDVKALQDSWLTIRVLDRLGISTAGEGNFWHARRYFTEASQQNIWLTKHHPRQAILLLHQGVASWLLGDYTTALEAYDSALSIIRKRNDKTREEHVQWGLARVQRCLGNYEHALTAAEVCLKLSRPLETADMISAYNNLGHILAETLKWDKAANAFQQAITLAETQNLIIFGMESYAGLATVLLHQGHLKAAMFYVEKVLDYLRAGNSFDVITEPMQIYWQCYQVLFASQDIRALKTLQLAHIQLMQQANLIDDETAKKQFLEKVSANRAIIKATALRKSTRYQRPQISPLHSSQASYTF